MSSQTQILNTKYFPNGNMQEEESIVIINNETLFKYESWYENGVKSFEELRCSYQSLNDHDIPLIDEFGSETFQVSQTKWNELGLEVESSYINKPYNFVHIIGTIFQHGKSSTYFDNGQSKQEKNLIEIFTDEDVYGDGRQLPVKCWIAEGLQTEWYENGQMLEQGNFKGNKANGLWKTWSETGQKKYERNFINGELEIITHYSYYANGQPKSEIRLNDFDENHGKQIAWHENGQIEAEEYFINGVSEKYITYTYYENGVMASKAHCKLNFSEDSEDDLIEDSGYFDGIVTSWYEDGQKSEEGLYEDGLKEGHWTKWHQNGQKSSEDFYQADYKYGKSTSWYSDGQKFEEVNYKKHAFHGKYITWHSNGQKEKEGHYVDDYKDGQWTYWYLTGQIESKINYKPDPIYFLDDQWSEDRENSSINGLVEDWYENGQKMRELQYKNGQLEGRQVVWDENGKKLEESVFKDGDCVSGDCLNQNE